MRLYAGLLGTRGHCVVIAFKIPQKFHCFQIPQNSSILQLMLVVFQCIAVIREQYIFTVHFLQYPDISGSFFHVLLHLALQMPVVQQP